MLAGFLVSIPLGVMSWDSLTSLTALPVVATPTIRQIGWSFDTSLMLPFAIVAIANGLKAAALLTASQRIITPDWARPDMEPIGRGLLSDGLAVVLTGCVSAFAANVSASSMGLTSSA